MNTRLTKVFWVFLSIPISLLSHYFLVLLWLLLINLIQRWIGRRKWVHILMYKIDNSLYKVRHGCFTFPVFSLQNRHANISSLVYMNVQEGLFEPYLWSHTRVFLWKSYLNWIYSTLPKSSLCSRHPKNPFCYAWQSLRHTLNHFSIR